MSKYQVLVLCTGNSMRSQLGEALLRHELGEWIDVYSAGTHPSTVHPLTLQSLEDAGISTAGLRSKGVLEFLNHPMDLVITVCDSAKENCPILPGAKRTIHKGYPDPYYKPTAAGVRELMDELRDQMRTELRALVIRELDLGAI